MSDTRTVVVGEKGRIVIPAEVRTRLGLDVGSRLCLVETSDGLVLMTRKQLLERVRRDLAGVSLVDSLVADRRRAATHEESS